MVEALYGGGIIKVPTSYKLTIICGIYPKVDMNKFDGFDPIDWVTSMEHYFSLHIITNDLMKIRVGILYMDPEKMEMVEMA